MKEIVFIKIIYSQLSAVSSQELEFKLSRELGLMHTQTRHKAFSNARMCTDRKRE